MGGRGGGCSRQAGPAHPLEFLGGAFSGLPVPICLLKNAEARLPSAQRLPLGSLSSLSRTGAGRGNV